MNSLLPLLARLWAGLLRIDQMLNHYVHQGLSVPALSSHSLYRHMSLAMLLNGLLGPLNRRSPAPDPCMTLHYMPVLEVDVGMDCRLAGIP